MKEEELDKRAAIIAEQFAGCGMSDAVDILGTALVLAAKKNNVHIAIPIYHIGKLIEEMHGRSALIKIISLSIMELLGRKARIAASAIILMKSSRFWEAKISI